MSQRFTYGQIKLEIERVKAQQQVTNISTDERRDLEKTERALWQLMAKTDTDDEAAGELSDDSLSRTNKKRKLDSARNNSGIDISLNEELKQLILSLVYEVTALNSSNCPTCLGVGSAVGLGHGVFVSAWHVIEGYVNEGSIHVRDANGAAHEVKLIESLYQETLQKIDVVFLELANPRAIRMPSNVRLASDYISWNDDVFLAGFAGNRGQWLCSTDCSIVRASIVHDVASQSAEADLAVHFTVSPGIENGYSGGGVFTKRGELGGIIVQGTNQTTACVNHMLFRMALCEIMKSRRHR